MFKKILVPLDGSELAAKILSQVEDVAKSMQAQVTLITVATLNFSYMGEIIPDGYGDYFDQVKTKTEKYLSEIGNSLKSKGVTTDWIFKETGSPAQEIISYAEKNSYDLIAMATHGKGEIAWVIGSVAEKVVTHATVPVLLVRVLQMRQQVEKSEYSKL
jgi:nucleotide-binding universal stress UspA family protein